MLTQYGRIRKYKDGVEFEWNVEGKQLKIKDSDGNVVWLPKKKIPTLQRFLLSIQHLPETKLRDKDEIKDLFIVGTVLD